KIKLPVVKAEWSNSNKRYYMVTALAWGLTILFSLRAFQLGQVSTIVPLQAVAVMLNVMVAYIFQNERKDLAKKLLSAVVVIIGVYLTVA
ncbi:MAG: family transporter, partial [Patescibacteria group bacterium]|nr:family transporter [Patescibacteria group bacterium]